MTIKMNDNGVISLFQGDTGYITINGLDDTKTFNVYFAFKDKNMNQVGEELMQVADCVDHIKMFLPATLTDLLTVPPKRTQETYYYGVKISCVDEDGNLVEDTVIPGFGKQRTAIVYPKWAEGPV